MISYIIVDDEPLAHQVIEEFCKALPHLSLKGNCYSAMEAMQFLSKKSVDIMFLDLNMPTLKGFDFLRTLSKSPKVIVTTAYKEFALEGYQLNIVDYLLKPFSFERLVAAINKAISFEHPTAAVDTSSQKCKKFFIKGDKSYHQIDMCDILYIEGFGNYTKLFLKDQMILTHENVSHFQSFLPESEFLRVHKSFIISVSEITSIQGNMITIKDHSIPIGKTYKSTVTRLYK